MGVIGSGVLGKIKNQVDVEFCSSDPTVDIIESCNLTENFIGAVLSPWESLTGGFFGPVFWGIVVLAVYLKYRNAMTALLSGLIPLIFLFTVIPTDELQKIALVIITAAGLALYQVLHSRVETPQL